MTRVTPDLVSYVAGRLSPRDHAIVDAVGRLRLVSAAQLERLFFTGGDPRTAARTRRRVLERLVDLQVLARLERRIGGVRSGSSGYVYHLDRVGRRLFEPTLTSRVRRPEEPSALFVRHTLLVSEIYVTLSVAARLGQLDLLAWEGEPDCWRRFTGRGGSRVVVRPDAYARLGVGAYEDRYFLELDTGTHGAGAVRRKLDTYIAYWKSGHELRSHGVFPKILWVATTEARAAGLVGWCGELPPEAWKLFAVVPLSGFLPFITSEVGV